jgi:carbon monoxide dehydrogenase subunit G
MAKLRGNAHLKLHNEFSIPLPPAEAWDVLNDVPRVAKCVPGAKLLEQAPDGGYVGTVGVRLGPIALSFKGKFTYKEIDASTRRVRAEASGSEQKARGTAQAQVEFVLREEQGGTRVSVDTDVQLAGSIAQYARGGTLIESTAQVLTDQFASNLKAELAASRSATASAAAPETGVTAAPEVKEISAFTLLTQGLRLAFRRWLDRLRGASAGSRDRQ